MCVCTHTTRFLKSIHKPVIDHWPTAVTAKVDMSEGNSNKEVFRAGVDEEEQQSVMLPPNPQKTSCKRYRTVWEKYILFFLLNDHYQYTENLSKSKQPKRTPILLRPGAKILAITQTLPFLSLPSSPQNKKPCLKSDHMQYKDT